MNKYDEIICVAGLLTILSTASAIANDLTELEQALSLAGTSCPVHNVGKPNTGLTPHHLQSGLAKRSFGWRCTFQDGVSLTDRVCEGSFAQISAVDLSKNIKVNNILENAEAIAAQKSTPDAAKASFWWAAEQFDPFNGKLVQNWVASSNKEQIDMVVDWQLWTLLDYFDRYRFVNQFGTVARKYGYSLIIFDRQNRCLASYKYNAGIKPPKWELNLENYGEDSLQVEPQQRFDELKPQL